MLRSLQLALAFTGVLVHGHEVAAGGAPVPKEQPPSHDTFGTFKPGHISIEGWSTFLFDDDIMIGAPGGRSVAARRVDLATGKTAVSFDGHDEEVNAVRISADRKLVATGSGKSMIVGPPPKDATVRLFDSQTGKLLAKLEGHARRVVRVDLSPKNDRLLSVGDHEGAILWDVGKRRALAAFPKPRYPDEIQLSPDGRFVSTWEFQHTLKLWDAETGKKEVHSVKFPDEYRNDHPVIDWRNLRVLARGLQKPWPVIVWDVRHDKEIATFLGHSASAACLGFVPGTSWVVSGSLDGTARVWDIDTKNEVAAYKHDGPVRLLHPSRNGKTLYAEWVDDIGPGRNPKERGVLWDLTTGKEIAKEDDFVGFNPDGSRYLTVESVKGIAAGKPAVWYDSVTGKKIEK